MNALTVEKNKMSIQDFPCVYKYIMHMCAKDDELLNIFANLEVALNEKAELKQAKKMVQRDMDHISIDLKLVREASSLRQEEHKQMDNVEHFLTKFYTHLLKMGDLLNDDKLKNAVSRGVLCKQFEVQEKLDKIKQQQELFLQWRTQMDNREIVQNCRHWQLKLREAEAAFSSAETEFYIMDRQWNRKLDLATQRRDRKIVSLVQQSKKIAEFQMPVSVRAEKQAMEPDAKARVLLVKNKPLILQSAMDFINNFAERNDIEDMDCSTQPALRSILVVNRPAPNTTETESTISPTKQVHFAPLPSPVHSNKKEQMINDPSMDMAEELSESSEGDTVTNIDQLPETAIIQKVEVLPTLDFSSGFSGSLNFNNLLSSVTALDSRGADRDSFKKPSCPEMLEAMDESDSLNTNELDMDSSSQNANDNFLLNFSDGKGSSNFHSYDL